MLEKESLDLNQIKEVLGERPFKARANYREYLETIEVIKDENEKVVNNNEEQKKEDVNI